MHSTCKFPRCVALVSIDHEYCAVHPPERVLERARQIVKTRCANLIKIMPERQKMIEALQSEILADLDSCV